MCIGRATVAAVSAPRLLPWSMPMRAASARRGDSAVFPCETKERRPSREGRVRSCLRSVGAYGLRARHRPLPIPRSTYTVGYRNISMIDGRPRVRGPSRILNPWPHHAFAALAHVAGAERSAARHSKYSSLNEARWGWLAAPLGFRPGEGHHVLLQLVGLLGLAGAGSGDASGPRMLGDFTPYGDFYGDFDFVGGPYGIIIPISGAGPRAAHLSFNPTLTKHNSQHATRMHTSHSRARAPLLAALSGQTPSYSTTHANRHTASTPDSPHFAPAEPRTAPGCPLPRCPRIPPLRREGYEKGSTGRVTENNRVRLGRPSPSRSQIWKSIQIWISIQNGTSIRGSLVMRSSPPSPRCRRPPSPLPRTHSLMHSRIICCRVRAVRPGLLHPLAAPRLAHDSAAAARPLPHDPIPRSTPRSRAAS